MNNQQVRIPRKVERFCKVQRVKRGINIEASAVKVDIPWTFRDINSCVTFSAAIPDLIKSLVIAGIISDADGGSIWTTRGVMGDGADADEKPEGSVECFAQPPFAIIVSARPTCCLEDSKGGDAIIGSQCRVGTLSISAPEVPSRLARCILTLEA